MTRWEPGTRLSRACLCLACHLSRTIPKRKSRILSSIARLEFCPGRSWEILLPKSKQIGILHSRVHLTRPPTHIHAFNAPCMMNPHQQLHQGPSSTAHSSHASQKSSEVSQSSGTRERFLSKINKFVLRAGHAPPKSERSISAPSPLNPFKIVHEPDTMPLYSPPRSMMPRTESECEEALKEMFSYTRDGRRPSTAPSEGQFSQIRTFSDQK